MAEAARKLVAWFEAGRDYVIAFSGGVDSAVVAKAASLAAGNCSGLHVVLATGDSPSLARQELRDAETVAALIDLPHQIIESGETNDPEYKLNDARRCYHCKSNLFEVLERKFPASIIVTGTNSDDLQDYRPGLVAAAEHKVRSPLAELRFDKAAVRAIAELWSLPIADKPASPCLASRLAYGVEVTGERLAMVENAEAWLRDRGFSELRVRLHAGELARIEVGLAQLSRLVTEPMRGELHAYFKALGFRFVTVDLGGFASGSLNQLIQIQR